MLAHLAHDLRAFLSVVLLEARVAIGELESKSLDDLTATVRGEGLQLVRLVEGLRLLSQFADGSRVYRSEIIDMPRLVREAIQSLHKSEKELFDKARQITVGIPEIRGDEELVRESIVLLLVESKNTITRRGPTEIVIQADADHCTVSAASEIGPKSGEPMKRDASADSAALILLGEFAAAQGGRVTVDHIGNLRRLAVQFPRAM